MKINPRRVSRSVKNCAIIGKSKVAINCEKNDNSPSNCHVYSYILPDLGDDNLPSGPPLIFPAMCTGCLGGKLEIAAAENGENKRKITCMKQGLKANEKTPENFECINQCDGVTTTMEPETTTQDFTGSYV